MLAAPVLATMLDHLNLEARIGGYEAAAAQATEVSEFYAQIAALINSAADNIAFAGSATHAYATALSAIPFEPGDVVIRQFRLGSVYFVGPRSGAAGVQRALSPPTYVPILRQLLGAAISLSIDRWSPPATRS
jgi:hypothetical protein